MDSSFYILLPALGLALLGVATASLARALLYAKLTGWEFYKYFGVGKNYVQIVGCFLVVVFLIIGTYFTGEDAIKAMLQTIGIMIPILVPFALGFLVTWFFLTIPDVRKKAVLEDAVQTLSQGQIDIPRHLIPK